MKYFFFSVVNYCFVVAWGQNLGLLAESPVRPTTLNQPLSFLEFFFTTIYFVGFTLELVESTESHTEKLKGPPVL